MKLRTKPIYYVKCIGKYMPIAEICFTLAVGFQLGNQYGGAKFMDDWKASAMQQRERASKECKRYIMVPYWKVR